MTSDDSAYELKTLFAKQERIYPKRVNGRYRNLKWLAMVVTLAIYYLTPFIRWERGPNAPDQAVLIDLVHGRAYWFWFEIWPQEVFILTGILVFAAIGLFFLTSLFGRVWCGYLCFQTVWTDLFVWVERIVQGDRTQRKRLREGPWTKDKFVKLALTHFLWLVIGWVTAGSFVLYFNDAPSLVRDFLTFNVSPTLLMVCAGLTFSTYLMAGFAREQVCTFMCPYARFQSAMFDKDTLIIGYDAARGEPRGHHKKGEPWDGRGHCIDCTACVQVCPMGIDIRNGLQMQCIACGLCIDACDEVMKKVDLPTGLVRYDTENRMTALAAAAPSAVATPMPGLRLVRPRTLYYLIVLCAVGGLILTHFATRAPLEITALHDRNPLFVTLSDGGIRNGYDVKILNKTHQDRRFRLTVEGLSGARLNVRGGVNLEPQNLPVPADSVGKFKIFVEADVPPAAPRPLTFMLEDQDGHAEARYETMFITQRDKE